ISQFRDDVLRSSGSHDRCSFRRHDWPRGKSGVGGTTPQSGMRLVRVLAASLALVAAAAPRVHAQDQSARIRAQREELDRIRREREQLERRADELRYSIHDLDEEVNNIERRADA